MGKLRKRLSDLEATKLGLSLNKKQEGRRKALYKISKEQWEQVQNFVFTANERAFVETQIKKGKNGQVISTLEKLQAEPIEVPENFEVVKISTSQTTGQQWVQYEPKKESKEVESFDLDAIVSKHIKRIPVLKQKQNTSSDFDTLTYTDVHVGMETNKYNNSMYAVEWNKSTILDACDNMAKKTISNKKSNVLYVDELGDLLDGFNAKTTRGGHELPQNMTNEEAFDCALSFKMNLLDNLIHHYEKIVFNNVCNDNHAGSFGYFVNQAFKKIAELKYDKIKVVNHRTFLSHYFVNDICFVISHGKDDMTLKFGFKPHLDTKQIEKIDQYLKQNKVYGKAERIIFKKGDSHQALFDMAGSDDFDYFNYPALSPSSQWVQNNFKKGRRGFVIEHFNGTDSTMTPIFN